MRSSLFVVLVGVEPTMFTTWVSDFKSDAFPPFSPQDHIKQKTRTFYGSGLYFIWNYLLRHEINPNFAQPEPAVLIHNVFTTIVRFKLIFRFIVFIISYILKSLCPFRYFIQIKNKVLYLPKFILIFLK